MTLSETSVSLPEGAALEADGDADVSLSGTTAAVPLKLTRAVVAERPARVYGFCPYCGHACYGPTCRAHRDLLELDTSMPRGAR